MFCAPPLAKQAAKGWASPGLWGVVATAIPLWGGCAIALVGGSCGLSAQAQAPAVEVAPVSQPSVPTVSGGRIVRPTLRLGSQGESVRELQSMLQLLGYYPGPVTGLYQEDTATATRRFQTAAAITADGIVGPATWSRLFPTPPSEANPPTPTATPTGSATPVATTPSASTPPTNAASSASNTGNATAVLPVLRPGMEGDVVRQLQQRLKTKGFYNGAIDGIFGSQTEASVRQVQAANDLTVDGIVGPATWRALN
ncbi:MAG: peptidoglycan-binding protein [Nodosilinea sp.]